MDVKAYCFEHDYENDTLIQYVNTGLYSVLFCEFTSEDPDYGVESLIYQTTDKSEPADQLAYELLHDITAVIDYREGKVKTVPLLVCLEDFDCCSTLTLIAFEAALREISKTYKPIVRNTKGNVIQIVTIEQAADIILKALANNNGDVSFDVLSGDIDGHDITEFVGNNHSGSWFGIRSIPLDMFDGRDNDRLVVIGHYGGGYAESLYVNSKENYAKVELIQKMCYEFDAKADEKIVLETITTEAK